MSFPNLEPPVLTFEKMNTDEQFMSRCIELATRGSGYVAPNPLVGAVLVHESRIIGEGWHERYGQAHAEVNCVNNAIAAGNGSFLASSTLFVNLEPCSHTGKTPPCTDLILRHQIPKVVIGIRDPFDKVNGRGIARLQDSGVNTTCGVLEKECEEVNRRFITFQKKQRPYIILKWAQNARGIIGSGNSRLLISNEFSNRQVHAWRSGEAAILVGPNTARSDNPALTNRYWPGPSPVRVLLDPHLVVEEHLRLFDGVSPLVVLNDQRHSITSTDPGELWGINYCRTGDNSVPAICKALYDLNLQSVLVEGGAKLLQSFIDAGIWDEARVISSPGNGEIDNEPVMAPALANSSLVTESRLGSDRLRIYEPA
jgi:diaminohydroxyphosphoribosylaminopyrimidine deaminase/5-amino-6-(5-phosphoribosylamino)uracil reductase